jgi:C1A family cysteine protease
MKVALLLVVLFAAVFATRKDFIEFQRKYNKVYSNDEEFAKRYQIFEENMKIAKELTIRNNGSAIFGVTKFSDLSQEEFRSLYLMPPGTFKNYVAPPQMAIPAKTVSDPDPTNYDWSATGCITPVYNQGQCGSCWAFSATETIESYNCLAGNPLVGLSMEQIVDCDTNGQDQGCNGGFPSGAYDYVESAGGIDTLSSYGYTAGGGTAGTCNFQTANIGAKVASYKSISGETGLYAQLSSASGGPVSVCVDASSWQTYQSGVLTTCTNNVDHCVQLTGYANYGQSGAYWNVRNSWDVTWGVNGYIWIAIGQDLCSIGDYATVVQTA